MKFFFRPTSRIIVSKPIAICMNTLNMLGPALLLCAVLMMMFSHFGDHPPDMRQLILNTAALLVAIALAIRIAWGMAIRIIARQHHTVNSPPLENDDN